LSKHKKPLFFIDSTFASAYSFSSIWAAAASDSLTWYWDKILMNSIEKDENTFSFPNNDISSIASSDPLLPHILSKYNTEEVKFLDVGPTQNVLKGKSLPEIFPANHDGFTAMFDSGRTNLTTIYFQLGTGYPEGFKVRMPVLKITQTAYQIGLLEYSNLNPKNSVFRSDSEKEFSNYIPTTLRKVHFLQEPSGTIEPGSYNRVIDTVYEFLFYLTGAWSRAIRR
jgi:hypothetical protein